MIVIVIFLPIVHQELLIVHVNVTLDTDAAVFLVTSVVNCSVVAL